MWLNTGATACSAAVLSLPCSIGSFCGPGVVHFGYQYATLSRGPQLQPAWAWLLLYSRSNGHGSLDCFGQLELDCMCGCLYIYCDSYCFICLWQEPSPKCGGGSPSFGLWCTIYLFILLCFGCSSFKYSPFHGRALTSGMDLGECVGGWEHEGEGCFIFFNAKTRKEAKGNQCPHKRSSNQKRMLILKIKARSLKKQTKIQSTWASNINIFIKLNGTPEEARVLIVKSIEELDKIQWQLK